MKEKRKRKRGDSNSAQTTVLIMAGLLGVLALGGVAAFLLVTVESDQSSTADSASISVGSATEMLIVPFDRAEATTTELDYQGMVQLQISGSGQAAGNSSSDAFYLFTDEAGEPRDPPETEMFDLEIDGERAIYQIASDLPAYNPDHVYSVYYNVGSTARRIAFRISDDVVGDNSGQFTITVIQLAG